MDKVKATSSLLAIPLRSSSKRPLDQGDTYLVEGEDHNEDKDKGESDMPSKVACNGTAATTTTTATATSTTRSGNHEDDDESLLFMPVKGVSTDYHEFERQQQINEAKDSIESNGSMTRFCQPMKTREAPLLFGTNVFISMADAIADAIVSAHLIATGKSTSARSEELCDLLSQCLYDYRQHIGRICPLLTDLCSTMKNRYAVHVSLVHPTPPPPPSLPSQQKQIETPATVAKRTRVCSDDLYTIEEPPAGAKPPFQLYILSDECRDHKKTQWLDDAKSGMRVCYHNHRVVYALLSMYIYSVSDRTHAFGITRDAILTFARLFARSLCDEKHHL